MRSSEMLKTMLGWWVEWGTEIMSHFFSIYVPWNMGAFRPDALPCPKHFSFFFFLRCYLFLYGERGREAERVGERHQCVVASCTLTRYQTHDLWFTDLCSIH